jgi:hypothetical protein
MTVSRQLNCRYLANYTTYSSHYSYRFLIPTYEFDYNRLLTHIMIYLPSEYQQDLYNKICKSMLKYKSNNKYIIKQINMYNHQYIYYNRSVIYDPHGERIEYKIHPELISMLNARFKYIQI